MPKLTFDPINHVYKLGRKLMTGVTTSLSLFTPNFEEIKEYVARITTEAMIQGIRVKYPTVLVKDLKEVAKTAKLAHVEALEMAGLKGTEIHEEIHKIVDHAIKETKGKIQAKVRHHEPQVTKFLMWSRENDWEWLRTEQMVYSEEYGYAGRLDLIGKQGKGKNRKIYIVDIKTGKVYDRKPFAQLAAYRKAYEEMGLLPSIDAAMVLRLTPESEGRKVKKSETIVSEHYKDDWELYRQCLGVYRNIQQFSVGAVGYKKKQHE